jgi:hypothetical protein
MYHFVHVELSQYNDLIKKFEARKKLLFHVTLVVVKLLC